MNDLLFLDQHHVWHPYTQARVAPTPILVKSANGARIVSEDGREYLDLVSSWWVNLHGHSHPIIAEAIARQARTLEHVIFADFTHEPAIRLAAKLANLLPGDLTRVFFSDDGSTAVEVALKTAHQFWLNRGEKRKRFIAFEGGYHGDTFGAMAAGASSGFFGAWQHLLFAVEFAPFPATWEGDRDCEEKENFALARLQELFSEKRKNADGEVCAVIIEPLLQGSGGMRMCRPEFLKKVAEIVKSNDSLLIFDEVMTGFGRTGPLFACNRAEVVPDLICLSKGLTGGFMPLGATVCRESLYEAFLGNSIEKALLHGHSFTANPLGCAAALASIDLLESPECGERRETIENVHRKRISSLSVASRKKLERPRQIGTVAAIDFAASDSGYGSKFGPKLKQFFLDRGLLIRPLGNVLYLLPPYCVEKRDLERAWDAIEEAAQLVG